MKRSKEYALRLNAVLICVHAVKVPLSKTLNPRLVLGLFLALIPHVTTSKNHVFDSETLKPLAPWLIIGD